MEEQEISKQISVGKVERAFDKIVEGQEEASSKVTMARAITGIVAGMALAYSMGEDVDEDELVTLIPMMSLAATVSGASGNIGFMRSVCDLAVDLGDD